jgi:hypothetical protein
MESKKSMKIIVFQKNSSKFAAKIIEIMYSIEVDEQLVNKAMTISGRKSQHDTIYAALFVGLQAELLISDFKKL